MLTKFANRFEEWIGGVLFLVMLTILTLQIGLRPIVVLSWSEELARLIFVYLGMLGVSIGIRKQQHVYIDFIYLKLPHRIRYAVNSLFQFLIYLSILFFIFFGFLLYNKAAGLVNDPIVTLDISRKWLYLPLALIGLVMFIRFIQVQFELWRAKQTYIHPYIFLGLTLVLVAVYFIDSDIYRSLALRQYFDLGQDKIWWVLFIWLIAMIMGLPVGWSLMMATVLYFALGRWNIIFSASDKLISSVNSFSLLSVPLFILTGILMNSSGITERIFNFAKAVFGHLPGGLGHVNISASLIFSGMSGSALADAGGLGQMEIKAMRDAGYDDDLSGGITAASCIIGPLVPPSIAMIIYGVIANVSIKDLFVAGFVPGVLLTIALMVMNSIICKRRKYPLAPKATKPQRRKALKDAFAALLTPIIIIVGIFQGFFTPTEAAAAAAVYSIILGKFIYKELTLKKLFDSCVEALAITGVTVLMVMTVTFFGDMIVREQVAIKIAQVFTSIASSKLAILVMINALLLFLGLFIDALALQFLVLPMLIPLAVQFDIDLIFFGVMTTLNMMIGILTPPMGMALFVVARTGNMPVSTVAKGIVPFLVPIFVVLIAIVLFPQIVTFLPYLLH